MLLNPCWLQTLAVTLCKTINPLGKLICLCLSHDIFKRKNAIAITRVTSEGKVGLSFKTVN